MKTLATKRAPLVTLALGLLCASSLGCHATKEAQDSQAEHAEDALLTYDVDAVGFPPHTFVFTLPVVPSIEDYRFELTPIQHNTSPCSVCMLSGRLVSSESQGELSYYVYDGSSETITSQDYTPKGSARQAKYFAGEPLLLPFRGNRQVAVTLQAGIQLGYRYWKATGAIEVAKPSATPHSHSPKGFVPYVITAPEGLGAESYYIELIPSKLLEVDCNIHVLNGKFELQSDGESDLTYIFRSDGTTLSTRMGCPEESLEEKLIRHPGIVVLRQAGASGEVCLPEGFIMRYRLYAPEGDFVPLSEETKGTATRSIPQRTQAN